MNENRVCNKLGFIKLGFEINSLEITEELFSEAYFCTFNLL